MLKLQIKSKPETHLNIIKHLPRVIQILSVFRQPQFAKGNSSRLLYCIMWDPKMLIFNAKLISVWFARYNTPITKEPKYPLLQRY